MRTRPVKAPGYSVLDSGWWIVRLRSFSGDVLWAPVPGQEFVDALGWVIRQAGEHVGEPGLRIDVVELGGGNERVEGRCPSAAFVRAGECPVAAPDRHCPFILPMSGKSWKSITGGTRILAAKSAYGGWSNERRADFLRSWGRPALSCLLLIGCSIPLFALE